MQSTEQKLKVVMTRLGERTGMSVPGRPSPIPSEHPEGTPLDGMITTKIFRIFNKLPFFLNMNVNKIPIWTSIKSW